MSNLYKKIYSLATAILITLGFSNSLCAGDFTSCDPTGLPVIYGAPLFAHTIVCSVKGEYNIVEDSQGNLYAVYTTD